MIHSRSIFQCPDDNPFFWFFRVFFFLFYIYQKFIFLSKVPVKKILLYNKKVFYITLAKIQIAYSNYKYMQSIKTASALLHAEAVFSNIWSSLTIFELPANYTATQISISILSFFHGNMEIYLYRKILHLSK